MSLSLAALPAPKNSYDLAIPDAADTASSFYDDMIGDDDVGLSGWAGSSATVPDAATAREALRKAEAAEIAREAARRSAVLRHDPVLPRPLIIDDDAIAPPVGTGVIGESREWGYARGMIQDEVLLLLKADAVKYPVSKESKLFLLHIILMMI